MPPEIGINPIYASTRQYQAIRPRRRMSDNCTASAASVDSIDRTRSARQSNRRDSVTPDSALTSARALLMTDTSHDKTLDASASVHRPDASRTFARSLKVSVCGATAMIHFHHSTLRGSATQKNTGLQVLTEITERGILYKKGQLTTMPTMEGQQKRLAELVKVLDAIDKRRTATGDPDRLKGLEQHILDCELRDIERLADRDRENTAAKIRRVLEGQ